MTEALQKRQVIEVEGVSKEFSGVKAVRDASVTVSRGECVAIIGPNGAGKTTLFGVIAGEHQASAGRVLFHGRDVTNWRPDRRALLGLSRTFQVARLFSTRTVLEHLYIAASVKDRRYARPVDRFSWSSRKYRQDVEEILQTLHLEHIRSELAASLAQGDRKRLELAMAIVQHPDVLLLDEPTAGMSNEDCELMVELLDSVRKERSELSVIITGHDMSVIFALASRIVLMAEGSIVLDGSVDEVRSNELTNRVYLGATSND